MNELARLPSAHLVPGDVVDAVDDDDLVYVCANVGDADAQVLLLPGPPRRAIVVDAGRSGKVESLLRAFVRAGLLAGDHATGRPATGSVALVVATHPHDDHIRGMPGLLRELGDAVAEFWDPGYYHPIRAYHETMAQIEQRPDLLYAQPAAGLRRWIGQTGVTVLAPAIALRNRFDTYGIEINDASIGLAIEYPATRVLQRDEHRELVGRGRSVRLVLGADAQTTSWAHVAVDFPELHGDDRALGREIGHRSGPDMLSARVLKVAHHASKRGVNLELVERIAPSVTIVSCSDHGHQHNFPHVVAREVLREAVHPTEGLGDGTTHDWQLGIHYTSERDEDGVELGSILLRLRPNTTEMWRLGDGRDDEVDLAAARRWDG